MNNRSLSHSYVQNQQKSSWNDDPFDLPRSFAGVANMSHEQQLSDYAQELSYNYGKFDGTNYTLFVSDIPEDEKYELVRLYMEFTDRETGECVHGNDFSIDNNYTCALLALLKEDCQETRDTFADVTRKNIAIYYEKSLQAVIDQACYDLINNLNNEAGYYSQQCRDSGEITWCKF